MAFSLVSLDYAFAQEEPQSPLKLKQDLLMRTVSWQDQDNEVAYRAFGAISYIRSLPCGPEPLESLLETVEFSEELPANTTTFHMPPPTEDRDASVKDFTFTLEALGTNGEVLATDGFAFVADGFSCPRDELPVAGSGLGQTPSRQLAVPLAALLAFGAASLLGGLALRRKAA